MVFVCSFQALLLLPSQALRASSLAGRAKCTPVDRGKLCSKVNLKSDFSCYMFTVKEVAFRLKPPRGARPQGVQLWAAGGIRPKQCGGQPYSRPPQRDPIFRDAKVLLFWCDQQQKEHWLDIPFCCHIGWVFTRTSGRSLSAHCPLYRPPAWCSGGV